MRALSLMRHFMPGIPHVPAPSLLCGIGVLVSKCLNAPLVFTDQELREQGGNCFFTGQMSGRELSAAFASADVFVMPPDSDTRHSASVTL